MATKYLHGDANWTSATWYDAASGGSTTTAPGSGDTVDINGHVLTLDGDMDGATVTAPAAVVDGVGTGHVELNSSNVTDGATVWTCSVKASVGGGAELSAGTFASLDDSTGAGYNYAAGCIIAALTMHSASDKRVQGAIVNVSPTDKISFDGGTTWFYNPSGPSIAAAVGASASKIVSGQTIAGVAGTYEPPKEILTLNPS